MISIVPLKQILMHFDLLVENFNGIDWRLILREAIKTHSVEQREMMLLGLSERRRRANYGNGLSAHELITEKEREKGKEDVRSPIA